MQRAKAFTGALLLTTLSLLAQGARAQEPARGLGTERLVLREAGVWLRPIIEVRERGEFYLDQYYGTRSSDDSTANAEANLRDQIRVQHRVLLGADARWRWVRAYFVLRDARRFGDPSGGESGTPDLFQAFLEVEGDPGWLRVGRQEIRYASELFISGRPWGPGGSFDAIRGHLDLGATSLDAFGAWLTPPSGNAIGEVLSGLWLRHVFDAALVLDVTAYYRTDDQPGLDAAESQASATDRRHEGTGTIRLFGRAARLQYTVEAMTQLGERFDGQLHRAFAGRAWVSYTFAGPERIQLRAGGNLGTGEDPRGRFEGFDAPFGRNHRSYGILDFASLSNMGHGFVRFGFSPQQSNLTVYADALLFMMVEPTGSWRGHNGRLIGQMSTNGDPLLGGEIDLVATWRPDPSLGLQVGYGLFLPGGGASALGYDDISQFFYLSLQVRAP